MHTPAAESQSLHKHSLAYVKQNLPSAKMQKLIVGWFVLVLLSAACATLPRQNSEDRSKVAASSGPVLININKASASQLETLPGIGRVIAERIVTHREQYGAFRRAEHLMMVRGISDQKFRAIRGMIVVE